MNNLESTLSGLVSIPSVTRSESEREILIYVNDILNNILLDEVNLSGVNVTIEKIEKEDSNGVFHGGIVCKIKVSDNLRNIGLMGHLDVVPIDMDNWSKPPFKLTDTGEKYFGRGVADMKAGCSIMIEVLRKSLNKKPTKNISLIFTTGEENGIPNGLTNLITSKRLAGIDFAIALEPTGGKINTGIFGYLDGEFIFTGKTCHSSDPSLGENAIYKIIDLLEYLKNPDKVGEFEYFGETIKEALSATIIKGGIKTNIIPDLCKVIINHRYLPGKSQNDIENKFSKLAIDMGAKEFKVLEHNPPSSEIVLVENPFLNEFMNKTRIDIVKVVQFWTDISQTSSLGIPSINFGPGDIAQAHKDDEYLDKKSFTETWEKFKKYLFN